MICREISRVLTQSQIENAIYYAVGSCGEPQCRRYTRDGEIRVQALRSRLSGRYGFVSEGVTRRLIAELRRFQPDLVHLHNLHSHNCNLTMLLDYLRGTGVRLVWTMHDCWAFTGGCTHFAGVGCENWRAGCHACPQRKSFSLIFDRSRENYEAKKRLASDLPLTVVTPSHWMAEQVRASFFGSYPVHVIHNGIDLSVFQPTASEFRQRHGIPAGQKLLLGLAFDWSERKGLDVFIELARRLEPEQYRIVLVGTDPRIDGLLPGNILSIHRTENRSELAAIYTAADLFVNPTREDALGLVNIEANACGTPVLSFRTGGCPECIDEDSGRLADPGDVDALEREIRALCSDGTDRSLACVENAKRFDKNRIYQEYFSLYQSLF